MTIRADVAELLHTGLSDRAIGRQLHADRQRVAATRAVLGLPKTRSGGRPAASLEDAFRDRTRPVDGGHLEWTGHINRKGLPALRHNGAMHTAYRVAFRLRTGHDPVGRVRPDCDHPRCVAPEHVEDAPGRARTRQLLDAIGGQAASCGPHLSPRQALVLAAAADGGPLSVVAARLGTSREQVSARLSEAYRALDVVWVPRNERRAAAVRAARTAGLIPTHACTFETPEPADTGRPLAPAANNLEGAA